MLHFDVLGSLNAMVHLSPHEALSGVSGSISLVAWIFVLVGVNTQRSCNVGLMNDTAPPAD